MSVKETKISGFWSMLSFYCDQPKEDNAICDEPLELEMQNTTPIYRCKVCGFTIPFHDVEKAMQKISDILVDAAIEDEDINLANMRWYVRNQKLGYRIRYRVLSHKNNKIKIGISEAI